MGEVSALDFTVVYDNMVEYLRYMEKDPKPKKAREKKEKKVEESAEEEQAEVKPTCTKRIIPGDTKFRFKIKNFSSSEEERRKETREGKRKVDDDGNQLADENIDTAKKVKYLMPEYQSEPATKVCEQTDASTSASVLPIKLMLDLNMPPPDDI